MQYSQNNPKGMFLSQVDLHFKTPTPLFSLALIIKWWHHENANVHIHLEQFCVFFLHLCLGQVQNLTLRNQQGASSTSAGLQALSLKQTPVSIQPTPLIKTPSSGTGAGKSNLTTASSEDRKKGEIEAQTEMKALNMSRSVSSSHHLIAPGTLTD